MEELTERQRRFADLYLKLGNAERAAIEAGYSKSYARGSSYKLVDNDKISAYINERLKDIQTEQIAETREILIFLTDTMRSDKNTIIEGLRAAELLGKRYGLFKGIADEETLMPVVIIDDMTTSQWSITD